MDAQLLTADYFTLFQLPRTYDIDAHALRDAYRAVQSRIHPDKYAHGSDQEKRLAMQCAAHVNEGYSTLKDPVRRAFYLLELAGARSIDDNATLHDSAFLMEQMELREQLDELTEENASAFLDDVDHRLVTLGRAFSAIWNNNDQAIRQQAQTIARKMQFLNKLRSDADARF